MSYEMAKKAFADESTSLEILVVSLKRLSFDHGYLQCLVARHLIEDADPALLRMLVLSDALTVRILSECKEGKPTKDEVTRLLRIGL